MKKQLYSSNEFNFLAEIRRELCTRFSVFVECFRRELEEFGDCFVMKREGCLAGILQRNDIRKGLPGKMTPIREEKRARKEKNMQSCK